MVVISSSLAAAIDEMDPLRSWSSQPQPMQPQSTQFSAPGVGINGSQSPLSSQDGGSSLNKDEQMIRALDERELNQELQPLSDSGPAGMQNVDALKSKAAFDKQKAKKPQLLVKNEPGDGLIKLSWALADLPPGSDGKPLRFTILYGIESGKLIKSVMVGPGTAFVLRGLQNFQPYFIQVIALNREKLSLVKSDEIQVIALPAEEQGSQLEKSFSRKTLTLLDKIEAEPMRRELKQFGYDFFKNTLLLTSAIDAMPVTTDYQLGPGDVLNLNVWGAVNLRQELNVGRNGELTIPKVGPVRVWGLTFDKAQAAVKEALSRSYRNFDMSLTLGKLRSIQVYVVGEVDAPGNYPVSALATVINALAAAGGPSRNGSLRAVRITRGNQTVATVDLYDMLLSGDRNKDVQLQNGDTIFVPVIGSVVAVAGEVRRPAIYELNGKTTLAEILQMAGGVAASGSLGRIQIERIENNSSRIALDYSLKTGDPQAELGSVELKDRDMVKVFPVQAAVRQVVVLKGNVQQVGEYQFRPSMRLTDLIPSAQTLLPESYLDSVEITRMSPPDYRRELITVSLRRALAGNQADNLLLQEQDTVKVFSRWEMEEKPRVAVNGAVVNPGPYDYFPGMSVRDLVTAAGSAKRNAFLDSAELSRIVVTGDKAQSSRIQLDLGKALAGDPAHNLPLQSDDVLIVRGIANWQEATEKFITLKGEVNFPGVYSVASNEKLSSVIERAGGFSERAYLRGAKFTRRSVRELQQKRMDEIIIRSEKDIMQKQASVLSASSSREEIDATKAALDSLLKSLDRMKSLKAEGRVVIRLSALEDLKTSSNYNLVLEGGDQLEIPSRPSVVSVLGEVYNPTSFIYLPEKNINNYLQKSGGTLNNAETSEMYVIRADGTVLSRQQFSFGFYSSDDVLNWGGFLSSLLDAGDTLVVPPKLEKIAWMREIKDITQILANVALTAGTVLIGLR
jgi:protein involved in polysaccharide export with SLBB domain